MGVFLLQVWASTHEARPLAVFGVVTTLLYTGFGSGLKVALSGCSSLDIILVTASVWTVGSEGWAASLRLDGKGCHQLVELVNLLLSELPIARYPSMACTVSITEEVSTINRWLWIPLLSRLRNK